MNNVAIKNYLLSKPEAWEDFPFGPQAAVYKLQKKMFALLMFRNDCWQVNLKCDPDQAFALRDIFAAVLPAYHMNKTHWNTVLLDGTVPDNELQRMIDHSYGLVAGSLKKSEQKRLVLLYGEELLNV